MKLTDTHIHLYAGEFTSEFETLMQQGFDKDIRRYVIPNIDAGTVEPMFAICRQYPGICFPALGLHPCSVKQDYVAVLETIYRRFEEQHIVAIGETGIDLYWDKTYVKEQEKAFLTQLHWARDFNLPVIIHSRESTNMLTKILEANRSLDVRGIFHCFSGDLEQAKRITNLGFHLGIGGVLTFKNSGLAQVIEQIDLQYLVLETDAPYLAPAPHRGKRNEPAFLALVAEKLAAVKRVSVEEIAEITSLNAAAIFSFKDNPI